MPKHRNEIATAVAQSLHETERAIDSALSQVAEFVGIMPAARQDARFAAEVGQDALGNAVAAMAALTEARRAMIAAHASLADVQSQFRLQPQAFGNLGDKPPYPSRAHLRTVKAA